MGINIILHYTYNMIIMRFLNIKYIQYNVYIVTTIVGIIDFNIDHISCSFFHIIHIIKTIS